MRHVTMFITLAMGLAMMPQSTLAGPATTVTILAARHGLAPYLETAGAEELSTFNTAVLGQLMVLDDGFNVQPSLLSDAHFDFARNLFVLKLKDGLHFHGGRVADAKDLEFSLVRGFFSPNRSFYRTYIGNIQGIDAAVGKPYQSGLVSGVKVVDRLTVEVKLAAPNPSFLASLANPYFSIVPREAFDETLLTWKTFPVGVGPYRVVAPGFADGHVTLEKIEVNGKGPERVALYTADILPQYDISHLSSERVPSAVEVFRDLPGAVTTIFFSRLNPLGANPHFRKAVSLLVDRQVMASGIRGSTPTDQLLPRHFWGRASLTSSTNLDEAKREVAKIPVDLLRRSWRFARFMGTNHSPEMEFLTKQLTDQFAGVGLNLHKADTTEKFISEKTAAEYPVFIKSRITDYVDPLIMFASFRKGGHDPFLSPLNDERYEQLYAAASDAKLHEDRVSSVRLLSKYVVDNLFCVPLLERRYAFYYDPDRLKSLGQQTLPNTLLIKNIEQK